MKFLISALLLTLFANGSAYAGSALRVTCDDADVGAEVFINGKFKGECPLTMQVPEGKFKLRVQKAADAEQDIIFEKEIRMGDGVVKTEEVHFSARELNAAGKHHFEEEVRQALKNLQGNMVIIPGKNYEMGKTEVTQAQWVAVMGSNPSYYQGANLPVEQVSWNDVQDFIKKLNAMTGKQYRLPTEAEWKYACYGGSQTEYCGSNDIDAVAWYASNSGTHPVGQKQANGYGLYDMSGNVQEWMGTCNDSSCSERGLRGGSWSSDAGTSRAVVRGSFSPGGRSYFLGFRLARTLP